MSFIELENDDTPTKDITCPHCGSGFTVSWNTEYGEPIIGEHEVLCTECWEHFDLEVYISYYVPKRRKKDPT